MYKKNINFLLIKRVTIGILITLWVILIFKIFKSGGGMSNQLPKCIFTTLIIFAILNIIIKALEYIQNKRDNS